MHASRGPVIASRDYELLKACCAETAQPTRGTRALLGMWLSAYGTAVTTTVSGIWSAERKCISTILLMEAYLEAFDQPTRRSSAVIGLGAASESLLALSNCTEPLRVLN